VTIDRPGAANAIDLGTAQALSIAFDELERDEQVWAVVLIGAGDRVFCAGMDLKAVAAGEADAINKVPGGFGGLVRRVFAKPLIAAVNGAALGGGFELVLACDLVVASSRARFGLPEVTRGLIAASGGALRLTRRVPPVVALELLMTGEPVDARRAHELGLVNRVVSPENVLPEALAMAEAICANGPLAVRASKALARRMLSGDEEDGWRLNAQLTAAVMNSADAAEGARAAEEKRPPRWQAR